MLFDWLKRSAKAAVIAGVNEAVAELAGVGQAAPQVPEIRLMLPAPDVLVVESDEAPKKTRRVS